MSLQISQMNEVFDAIVNSGLNPREFEWDSTALSVSYPGQKAALLHKPTLGAFHFIYDGDRHAWSARYAPGDDGQSGNTASGEWSLVLAGLADWLSATSG
jgi:hypothetical protein